jgi:hypothetical protein
VFGATPRNQYPPVIAEEFRKVWAMESLMSFSPCFLNISGCVGCIRTEGADRNLRRQPRTRDSVSVASQVKAQYNEPVIRKGVDHPVNNGTRPHHLAVFVREASRRLQFLIEKSQVNRFAHIGMMPDVRSSPGDRGRDL